MPVKFDPVNFSDTDKEKLNEYFQNHPEILTGNAYFKLDAIAAESSHLPPGSEAVVNSETKITPSLLPHQLGGIVTLYELTPFSEIQLLNKAKKDGSLSSFYKKLGSGPTHEHIGLAVSGYLPKDRGHDVKEWAPVLGDHGYVSVLATKTIAEEPKHYLLVSVPHLPFASDTVNKLPILSIESVLQHEDYQTIRNVAERNANKIAEAFTSALGLELRHRKYDVYSKTSKQVAAPVAITFAETLKKGETGVQIRANIGQAQNIPSNLTIQPISPRIGAVVAFKIVDVPIEMPYTTLAAPAKTIQEIGATFVNDRVFGRRTIQTELPIIFKHDKHTQQSAIATAEKYAGTLLHPMMVVVNE